MGTAAWGKESYPGFVGCDFKQSIPRGVQETCHKFARVVCLDYFYLPAHYYAENYGTNWVSGKVAELLQGTVECVILPYDCLGKKRGLDENGSMDEQIKGCPGT